MEPQFLTYRRFNDLALVNELILVLDENGIEYTVEENSLVGNPLLVSGDELAIEYSVKLRKDDFNTVNDILVADEERSIGEVEKDYYLFDFTDVELKDILINFDEWSAFDFALARKILNERGVVVDDKEIETIKAERITTLEQPEKSQKLWVVVGYMSALLGGVLGIFIGWMMWRFKKILPNGDYVYGYVESDRRHGKRIFITGIVVFVLVAIQRIYLQGYY